MVPTWISECLSRIRGARVGVFGDFPLESRWGIVAGEIGSSQRRVRTQRYDLAGAGNIASRLSSLAANAVYAVGLLGDDLFGRHTLDLMRDAGIRSDGMLRVQPDWQTAVWGRAMLGDREVERFEFGAFNHLADVSVERLGDALDRTAAWCDLVLIDQVLDAGIGGEAMIDRVNRVIARHARCKFLVDVRHHAERYRGAMLKLNAGEAATLCGIAADDPEAARRSATELYRRTGHPVFVTRADRGVIVADRTGLHESPTDLPPGRANLASMGNAAAAGIAGVLAGGGDAVAAARFANLTVELASRDPDTPSVVSPDDLLRWIRG